MTDQPRDGGAFFYGILVFKDGKWAPHAKFDENGLGSALIKAEDLDKEPEFEGVKVMRIPAKGQPGETKEMWVSPRFEAKSRAQAAAQVRAGAKETKERMAAAHAARKAQGKKAS